MTTGSTRQLLDLVERVQLTCDIFGQDGNLWHTPKKVPACYERDTGPHQSSLRMTRRQNRGSSIFSLSSANSPFLFRRRANLAGGERRLHEVECPDADDDLRT